MTAEQLVFDLPVKTAFGRDDFFASPSNAVAVAAVRDWTNWPLGKLVLTGPEGAGKSHLAMIWAEIAGARIIKATEVAELARNHPTLPALCVEDVPSIAGNRPAQNALFHLHNLMQQQGAPLLMTGRGGVSGWGIDLPDLHSRLAGSNTVWLQEPDDALLSALLVKHFADRQLRVEPGLIAYMLPRMERSFRFARRCVADLDLQSLQNKRPVGVKMAARMFEALVREND